MKIYTKVVYDPETLRVIEAESKWYEYDGPVALVKGASPQETSIANLSTGLASTLSANYGAMFQGQTAILNSLNTGLTNIFNAGPNQYGFSPAEDTALRTQATEGTANTYNQALTALNQSWGAKGGGNTPIATSGPQSQAQTSIASATAGQESAEQLGITQAGYNVGRQNYWQAAGALGNTASLYNPLGYAGQSTSAANSAFNMQNTVNQQNQAASPWNAVAPILGGVAGSFFGPIGTALGSNIAKAIGGAASGSQSSQSQDAGFLNLGADQI